MSEDVLEAIVKQVMTRAGENVSFGWQGGEPTLMGLPFFEKVIEYQKQYGKRQIVGNGLQTNGILIDKQWAHFLDSNKFLVGLSLDGPEHIHNRYRVNRSGQSTWTRVVDSAKLMLDKGVAVNALTVVNDYSVQFPQDIYEFHKELGLTFMQFIPCLEPDDDNPERTASFSVSSEEYGDFLCRLFDLWIADFEYGTPTTSVRFFDSVFYNYVGLTAPDCTLLPECGVYVVIEHNGNVYSCDFFVEPAWYLGNVMQAELSEMLNSELQKKFGKTKRKLHDQCSNCQWLKYCWGGCIKDRNHNPLDNNLTYFCHSYQKFFEHADTRLRQLAQNWQRQQIESAHKQAANVSGKKSEHKIGRNESCSCGSGIKYKNCCGVY